MSKPAISNSRQYSPQSVRQPRWKLATLTWLGIFPAITGMLAIAEPLLVGLPLVLRTFLLTAVLAPAMTFVIMPALTRTLAPWLRPTG